jgi:gas vesicle protein
MRKLLSLILGGLLGGAVGAGLVTLFAPSSGKEFAAQLRQGYREALDAARQASEARRKELEDELAQLQNRHGN